jgi:hypothetical protein
MKERLFIIWSIEAGIAGRRRLGEFMKSGACLMLVALVGLAGCSHSDTEKLKRDAERTGQAVGKTASDAADATKRATQDAAHKAKPAVSDAVDKTKKAAAETGEYVKEAAQKAKEQTQKAADKVKQDAKDKTNQ